MGLFRRRSSHIDLQPNPKSFKIIKCKKIGKIYVSFINYPDAKNFEGNKILITIKNPKEMKILDPHFSEDINVIARFIPTDEGWELAIKCAKILEN